MCITRKVVLCMESPCFTQSISLSLSLSLSLPISLYPSLSLSSMDLPFTDRSSAVRPTLQTRATIQSSTSFSQDLFGLPLFLWPFIVPSFITFYSVCSLFICSICGVFQMWLRVHQLWISLYCAPSMMIVIYIFKCIEGSMRVVMFLFMV